MFVTIAEISCKVPEIASQDMAYYQLLFDFSYDGELYSNRVMLTVFDGECLECGNNCEEAANWKMLVQKQNLQLITRSEYNFNKTKFMLVDEKSSVLMATLVPIQNRRK